jgi:ATP-dependent Zn protease
MWTWINWRRLFQEMTGADLANLVNEAALTAARRGREAVTQRDLNEALDKAQLGTARERTIPEQDRRLIAVKYFSRSRTTIFPFCFDKGKQ